MNVEYQPVRNQNLDVENQQSKHLHFFQPAKQEVQVRWEQELLEDRDIGKWLSAAKFQSNFKLIKMQESNR